MKPDFDPNLPITVVIIAVAGMWLLAAGILVGLVFGEHVSEATEQQRRIEVLESETEKTVMNGPTATPAENGGTCSATSDESLNEATESNDILKGIAQDVEAIRNLMPFDCSSPKPQASSRVSFCPSESHNEPNTERDSDANRKATVALCLPAPEKSGKPD